MARLKTAVAVALAAVLATAAAAVSAGQVSGSPAKSGNPILPGWYADPEAAVFGDTYWIYPTTSKPYAEQVAFDAFSSKDLVTWTKHPGVLRHILPVKITNEGVGPHRLK